MRYGPVRPRGAAGTDATLLRTSISSILRRCAALRRIGLVVSRREGTSVYYRVPDAVVFQLLAAGRAVITRQLAGQQSILRELESS